MKKSLFLIIGAGILVLCCSSTINSLFVHRDMGTHEWQIDNPFLAKDIKVLGVKEVKEGSLLYVNVLLKNSWYKPITGKVKVEFYDRNGVQLENPWGWHPITLESHQEEWFKFMAPKIEKEISKIKIMIRGIGKASMP
ncbi:DUF1425 domain-containing protein [candidate division WOR-3 bacterium]|nr:DUF1425 domain-containing protein [candidate division WOR-3 bacterium]